MDYRAGDEPPKFAARGLTQWAVDLWPYVNGKALTLGLDIAEMESSKMLDVLHFFFEQDSRYTTREESEVVDNMRRRLYRELYSMEYAYQVGAGGAGGARGRRYIDPRSDPTSFDPLISSQETKPYIPPTDFQPDSSMPFGSTLEAPLR